MQLTSEQGSAPGRDRDPGRFSIPGFESRAGTGIGTGIPVKSRKFLESYFFDFFSKKNLTLEYLRNHFS